MGVCCDKCKIILFPNPDTNIPDEIVIDKGKEKEQQKKLKALEKKFEALEKKQL